MEKFGANVSYLNWVTLDIEIYVCVAAENKSQMHDSVKGESMANATKQAGSFDQ